MSKQRERFLMYIFVIVLWKALHGIETPRLEGFVIKPDSSQNVADKGDLKSTLSGNYSIMSNHTTTARSGGDDLQQSSDHQSCWRRCTHRRNKIVLRPTATNGGGGGLCDRATIFKTSINLAGYLCATVHVLPTDQILGSQHRHGHVHSLQDVPWSDLMDLRILPDNTSHAFQEYNPADASTLFPDNETNTWQRVRAQAHLAGNMKGITQSFERVEALSWKQDHVETSDKKLNNNYTSDYFIWTIDAPFYMWADAFALYLQGRVSKQANGRSDTSYTSSSNEEGGNKQVATTMLPTIDPQRFVGCTYSALYPPRHMQVMADRVWDAIQNELYVVQHNELNNKISSADSNMTVGYLHIRRNDATKYCNTSLERMRRFLECSFKDMAKSGNKVVLLFSSDEESVEYRQGIRKIIMDNEYGPFFDLDVMVRRAVQDDIEQLLHGGAPQSRANNYYIFHTIWTIARQHSAFQLSQRRDQSCPRCVEVTLDNLPQESLELEGQRKGIRWTKKTRHLQRVFSS
jgi:hypothetical protein